MLLFVLHMIISPCWILPTSVTSQTTLSLPQDSPSTVLIIGQDGTTDRIFFSGTIVAPEWVLTARSFLYHNASRLHNFLVYAGGNSYDEYSTKKFPPGSQLLKSYQSFVNTKYDLALLRTQGAFQPNEYVRVVPLADEEVHTEDGNFRAYSCKVASFGVLKPSTNESVHRIKDKVLVYAPCIRLGGAGWNVDHWTWQKQKLEHACTYRSVWGSPQCAATPGAGLVCEGKLVGVAHVIVTTNTDKRWIYEPVQGNPCRDFHTIGVFSLVAPHSRWIQETMRPDKFPHPFPGCDAFSQANRLTRSTLFLLILMITSSVH